jgi:hypothetical protein
VTGLQAQACLVGLVDEIALIDDNDYLDGTASGFCDAAEYSARVAAARAVIAWLRVKALSDIVRAAEQQQQEGN